jgi:hypothetical protein
MFASNSQSQSDASNRYTMEHSYCSQTNQITMNHKENSMDSANDNEGWQKVEATTKKRTNVNSSNLNMKRYRTSQKNIDSDGIKLTNSFQPLENSEEVSGDVPNDPPKEPKPPPIFIPSVKNIVSMVKALESMVSSKDFTYKCLNQDKVKIFPASAGVYRSIVKGLSSQNINFHTYQLKQERAYRAVLKNMHYSTPIDALKAAIEENGHKVRNILNVRHNITKVPLSLFFVDLEPNSNNKDIFNIMYLLNAKVRFEAPRRKKEVVQCKKCQQFGHTKSYCWNIAQCVKCAQSHETAHCTKNTETAPTCIHCGGEHPASYKGCRVYRELQSKNFPPLRQKSQSGSIDSPNVKSVPYFTASEIEPRNSKLSDPSTSYSHIVKEGRKNNQIQSNDFTSLSQIMEQSFSKFEKILLKQSEQIGTLLNLLTAVISKLN